MYRWIILRVDVMYTKLPLTRCWRRHNVSFWPTCTAVIQRVHGNRKLDFAYSRGLNTQVDLKPDTKWSSDPHVPRNRSRRNRFPSTRLDYRPHLPNTSSVRVPLEITVVKPCNEIIAHTPTLRWLDVSILIRYATWYDYNTHFLASLHHITIQNDTSQRIYLDCDIRLCWDICGISLLSPLVRITGYNLRS